MASYVDFPLDSETRYISRLVDLPLYRNMDERPEMTEISCEPPKPEPHDPLIGRNPDHPKVKKSVSCDSLSNLQHIRVYEPASEKGNYETFHGHSPEISPLRVQKQKKKKGFLKILFKKRNPIIRGTRRM